MASRHPYRNDGFRLACMSLNTHSAENPEFPEWVPPTSNDRPPVYSQWERRAAEAAAEKRAQVEDALRRNPPRVVVPKCRQWLLGSYKKEAEYARWRHARHNAQSHPSEAMTEAATPQPSLEALLQEQATMFHEASVVDGLLRKSERTHLRVLGRTEDLSRGAMDDVLAEARRITRQGRLAEDPPPEESHSVPSLPQLADGRGHGSSTGARSPQFLGQHSSQQTPSQQLAFSPRRFSMSSETPRTPLMTLLPAFVKPPA